MAGTSNSITTHNVLNGVLNADNVISGLVNTAFNPAYALVTQAGAQIVLFINSSDYKMYAQLKDKSGNLIYTSNIIDLPLETMVVDGRYDSGTKKLILVLDNGNEIEVPLGALISGLVNENDLVANYYDKDEIDVLLDGYWTKIELTQEDIDNWNAKQEYLNQGDGIEISADTILKGNTYQESTTGKNLLNTTLATTTLNGITCTRNDDGTYKLNGTASAGTSFTLTTPNPTLSAGTYKLVGIKGGSYSTFSLRAYNSAQSILKVDLGSGVTFTTNESLSFQIFIDIANGTTLNNVIVKPMITTDTSLTYDDYEPYTNGASPNPEYPQDIHIVSGDNSINVIGRNLFTLKNITNATTFGIERTINNSELKLNGTSSGAGQVIGRQTTGIILPSGTYSVLVQKKSGNVTPNGKYTVFYFRKPDGTEITALNINNYSGNYSFKTTFVLSEETELYVEIYCTEAGYTLDNLELQFYIESGYNSTPTYEAYIGESYPINLPIENLFELPETQTVNGITFTNNDNGTFNLSGTASAIADFRISKELNTIANEKYTISSKSTGYSLQLVFYNGNTWLSTPINKLTTELIKTGNITIPSNATRYELIIRVPSGSTINLINETVQLEKGSKVNSYTPFGTTPIELCKIGTYQDIIKKSTGKNLINFNNLNDVTLRGVTTSYLGSKFKMNGTTNEAGVIIVHSDLNITIPAGTYTLTFAVESGSNTGVGSGKDTAFYLAKANTATVADRLAVITISQLNTNNKYSVTFTTNEATPIYIYAFTNNSGMTFNDYVIQVQLEKGTQSTSFEPYGTGWYVKKEIGKTVITSFNSKSGTSNNYMYSTAPIDNIKKPSGGTVVSSILATHGISKAPNTMYLNDTTGVGINTDGTIAIAFGLSSTLTTKELANTWVASNNITAYYPLATPTYTGITGELISQLNALIIGFSNNWVENVSQTNADLPFEIEYDNKNLTISASSNLVRNTDYATSNTGGVIKIGYHNFNISEGRPYVTTTSYADYQNLGNDAFIGKGTLENVITGKGLVSNTDYANNNTGGVVKVQDTLGLGIGSTGNLFATTKTYATYQTLSEGAIVGKGTLDNVLNAKIGNIQTLLDNLNNGNGVE